MAGDWVKMRSALLANPKVHAIAKAIGRDPRAGAALTTGFSGCPDQVLSRNALRHVTVTALLCVWSSANEHAADGILSCCDLEDLDEISGVPGFGDAMASVGWAIADDEGKCVSLPNFNEHNTPAKDRTGAERQRRYRENRNGDVTPLRNAVTVTQRREEKRREEYIQPAAPVPTSDPPKASRTPAKPKVSWSADAGWEGITDADRADWATAYPGAVLEQELAKATAWLKANPSRAGRRNWRAFVVRWLSKCQERGGTHREPGNRPAPAPVDQAKRRYYRSDAGKNMTDAEYQTWRRDQRNGGMVAALASGMKLTEEDA
jgi:hypothetical protein